MRNVNRPLFLGLFINVILFRNTDGQSRDSVLVNNADVSPTHPLDPLSASELQMASELIQMHFKQRPLYFSTLNLKEPVKSDLLPFFLQDKELPPSIPRRAFAVVIDTITEISWEIVVNTKEKMVKSVAKVGKGLQPMFPIDEVDDVRDTVLADPVVQKRLMSLGVYNLSLVSPGIWDMGYVDDRPEYLGKRLVQVVFYIQHFPNDNQYAHPIGFIAIVDIIKRNVIGLENLPIHGGFDTTNRQGDGSVQESFNYDPILLENQVVKKVTSPPILTILPVRKSYKITGNQVEWQNFKLRIGFNDREGLVLHHINYNDKGDVRPLIYRASIVELFVPYGDPRPPFHRKMAFDAGNFGLGLSAHSLRPSDCPGSATFLDVVVNNKAGSPVTIQQAICIYEEDVGSLLKKYNAFAKRSYSVRAQRLVLSFTSTSGNYDYVFNWFLYPDASIKMEVQLHGIDNPNYMAPGSNYVEHGTLLADGVYAQHHQHLARLDVEFDGNKNTVMTVDAVSNGPTGSTHNLYGNGFQTVKTVLKTASEARSQFNLSTSRTWSIIGNVEKKHPVSNLPMGYRLIAEDPIYLLMNRDSPLHPKCAFVDYTLWVTPYKDDQLFPGGFYLNNSGLPEWVAKDPEANVENTDIVLWHVFGKTHITGAEDFPVMSGISAGFWLRPTNFFLENPAIYLPSIGDDF